MEQGAEADRARAGAAGGSSDAGSRLNGADARVAWKTVVRWVPPAPREGWRGALDRFFGPGTRLDEYAVQGLAVILLTAGVLWLSVGSAALDGLGWLGWTVLVVLAVDIAGGVVTNATSPAKRWYHREDLSVEEQLLFVGVHGVHLVLFTAVLGGMSWTACALFYALMLATAELLLRIPLHLQRPVAVSVYAGLLLLSLALVPAATGLAWFLPLFFLKIVVSHLVLEAPFRPA